MTHANLRDLCCLLQNYGSTANLQIDIYLSKHMTHQQSRPFCHLKVEAETRNTVGNDSQNSLRLMSHDDDSWRGFVREEGVFWHATWGFWTSSSILQWVPLGAAEIVCRILRATPSGIIPNWPCIVRRDYEKQGSCQDPIHQENGDNRSAYLRFRCYTSISRGIYRKEWTT